MSTAITVPFHGANLFVIEHNGQPYRRGYGFGMAGSATKTKGKSITLVNYHDFRDSWWRWQIT